MKSHNLIVLLLIVISGTPLLSNAATLHYHPTDGYVTSISGLDIGGSFYDATLYLNTSFNTLWDADNDNILGEGDGSLISHAPTFWGNDPLATSAALAIMAALGTSATTGTDNRDAFLIPYLRVNDNLVRNRVDKDWATATDVSVSTSDRLDNTFATNIPYVSFEASVVPLPGAFWLFGSGLIGLIGMARRK